MSSGAGRLLRPDGQPLSSEGRVNSRGWLGCEPERDESLAGRGLAFELCAADTRSRAVAITGFNDTCRPGTASRVVMRRLQIFGCALLFFCLSACSGTSADQAQETPAPSTLPARPDGAEMIRKRLPVRVEPVVRGDIKETIELTGTARPWDEFIVSPEISGRINEIRAEEGEWVQSGQTLVTLDQALRQLELRARQARLTKQKVDLDFLRRRFERGKALLEKGAISREELESLEQRMQIGESEVELAEIAVISMKEEIEDTVIVAPAAGRVSARHASVGEAVTPTTPVLTIIREDPLKVTTEVAELQLSQIRKGMNIPLSFDALPGAEFSAPVHFVHPVANPSTAAFPVELRLSNPGLKVRPGMVARIRMPAAIHRDVLSVPLDALLERDGAYHLFVVRDQVAHKMVVRLRHRVGSSAVIEGALAEGDAVVTSGNVNLTDGTPVEIIS